MTPLLLALVAALALGGGAQAAWRLRQGRRVSRTHHRALDTLGHMTASQADGGALLAQGDAAAQSHVRIVPADTPPPSNAPVPLSGGWRSRRATGAAPFRSPASTRVAPPAVVEEQLQPPAPEESVRLVYRPKLQDQPGADEVGTPQAPPPPIPRPVPASRVAPVFEPVHIPPPTYPRVEAPASTGRPSPAPPSPPGPRLSPETPAPPPTKALGLRPAAASGTARASADQRRADTAPREDGSGREGGTGVESALGGEASVLYFDSFDAAPGAWPVRTGEDPALEQVRTHRRRRKTTGSNGMLTAVAGLAVLIVAGSAAAAVMLRGGASPAASTTATKSVVSLPSGSEPTNTKPAATTTTTTLPVSLVSSTQQAAVYRVTGTAQISIDASGRCWVEVRQGTQSGPVVFTGTLTQGSTKAVSGPAWVRLGNPPAVSVSVDGTPISRPTAAGSPYNLEFE